MQLSLRKWYYLPETVTQAHYPLLQTFQQFVELQETQQIFASLAQTNAQNLDTRSAELKSIVGTWRDRLPNLWDDINVWSDLVAWRQHVFSAINKAYLPLVPPPNAPGGQQNASSFAYRGFHETAWIINRFAHVARKHNLNEVCITSLTKIYTLPNIEIQEAFLKLREQAKAHYQNPSELASGLEVINNTNLMYFNGPQKAEFFTLKGMFLAKLKLHDEANQTFNLAVSMDMSFPKAWAEWGEYHDRMFKENPTDLNIAANAVGCYLQAAGLYKSAHHRQGVRQLQGRDPDVVLDHLRPATTPYLHQDRRSLRPQYLRQDRQDVPASAVLPAPHDARRLAAGQAALARRREDATTGDCACSRRRGCEGRGASARTRVELAAACHSRWHADPGTDPRTAPAVGLGRRHYGDPQDGVPAPGALDGDDRRSDVESLQAAAGRRHLPAHQRPSLGRPSGA